MRTEATKAGAAPARESIWQFFVNKCANNLHIVMAMSPVGDTLRTRCRNFPGMVNNASIDWFFPWPEQALFAVASTFISPDVSCFHYHSTYPNLLGSSIIIISVSKAFRAAHLNTTAAIILLQT